jgi:catechol 2,3-dioxygenase-like lactoylglutathione lyase family enzyme
MTELTAAKAVTHILTKDPAVSIDFYQNKLGLTFVSTDDYGAVFDLANTVLRITKIPDYVAGAHPQLGWEVADIEKAAKELVANGIKLTIYEGYGQDELGIWTSPDGGTKLAWFYDPDMNVLSVSQH